MKTILKTKKLFHTILKIILTLTSTTSFSNENICSFYLSPRTSLFETQPMNSIDMIHIYNGEEQSWFRRLLKGKFIRFSSIKYYSFEEQAESEVYLKGGLFVDQQEKPISVTGYIYVVTEDGRLLIAKNIQGKIHHSSLAAGQAIISAGVISIIQGQISYLDNQSGHYRPDKLRFSAFTILLKNKGITLLPNAIPKQFLVDESWFPHLEREITENRM